MFRDNNNIMSLLLYPLRPPISIISTRVETLSNNRNLAKALPVLSLFLTRPLSLIPTRTDSSGNSGGGPHGSAGGSVDFIIRISDGLASLPACQRGQRERVILHMRRKGPNRYNTGGTGAGGRRSDNDGWRGEKTS